MSISTSIVSSLNFNTNISTVQYRVPPFKQCHRNFLRDVLNGSKRLIKKKDIEYISVPGWDELAVKNLWPELKDDSEFNIYFQDEFANDKSPNREYFFDILNTIYPEYLKTIMKHASAQRYTD